VEKIGEYRFTSRTVASGRVKREEIVGDGGQWEKQSIEIWVFSKSISVADKAFV